MGINKKGAILGEGIETFVATIFIAALLIIFALSAGFVKLFVSETGTQVDEKTSVYLSQQAFSHLDRVLSCKAEINGNVLSFEEILLAWDGKDAISIMEFFSKNCKTYEEHVEVMGDSGEGFWCGVNSECIVGKLDNDKVKEYLISYGREREFIVFKNANGASVLVSYEQLTDRAFRLNDGGYCRKYYDKPAPC